MKNELLLNHYSFTIPSWAVTAIEYGEYDSLSDSDIEMVESFVSRLNDIGHKIVFIEYGEEVSFRNFNDFHNLGDDCVTATVTFEVRDVEV